MMRERRRRNREDARRKEDRNEGYENLRKQEREDEEQS
jgi:hypothetical protein